jgi:hypothetical protein
MKRYLVSFEPQAAGRCVKTRPDMHPYMTAHDCSASAIEATAAEYDRLRQIVLENLHPRNAERSDRVSHSLEIHEHLSGIRVSRTLRNHFIQTLRVLCFYVKIESCAGYEFALFNIYQEAIGIPVVNLRRLM